MSLSREDIKKALGEMPVLELVELINELEEDWGVSAAASVGVAELRSPTSHTIASGSATRRRGNLARYGS